MQVVARARKTLADVLINAAYRLDPTRPKVTTDPETRGHTVTVAGVPIARISPGMFDPAV